MGKTPLVSVPRFTPLCLTKSNRAAKNSVTCPQPRIIVIVPPEMKTDVELIILPYGEETKSTLVDILIREFKDTKWNLFIAAVAFARTSGNIPELLDALYEFAERGGSVEMTFGANTFAEGDGSDYEAIETLLKELSGYPNVRLYLYNEQERPPYRTFHPKVYLFANANYEALPICRTPNGGFLTINFEKEKDARLPV